MTWPETLAGVRRDVEAGLLVLFAAHQFRPQTGVPEGSETAYVDLIEKIGTPPEEGTWEELSRASSRGLLTDDEYLVILPRRLDRRR